ncbi:ATP-dependent helicase [Agrococcus sp. SGAir0287]|uniref:ATP-dependent helicase n=1 Tax=Agrococcus sp. SGAir0287 TaxID=2070347 RepID=UPI0010CCB739|nr:ATP-dependent helicase [Agrococcus sp. SGAir0287]QCR18467.1 ATP-dependent helicase [Agrococcus sp. SGAir0287]
MPDSLDAFGPATAAWFRGAFAAPTPAQEGAWAATQGGGSALVIAPTGSGKTLAAFLTAIDRLASEPKPEDPLRRTRVLYLSPLKALGVDVERNLRSPLVGIARTAAELGLAPPDITVGVRSGDTPQAERRRLLTAPPDVLITTPESLFLMLTSAARETLAGVETIIVDEIHAVASTKRGAHLAVSLERLDAMLERPAQRIGLSATVRPPEAVARFLGGPRPVTIVAPESRGRVELQVVVPVDDMSDLGSAPPREGATSASADEAMPQQQSIWPHVEEAIVDRVLEQRSTIVFTNSRRLAERLTSRLNEIWAQRQEEAVEVEGLDAPTAPPSGQPDRMPAQMMGQSGQTSGAAPLLARAHHGSVSKDQRAEIEDDLKRGRLRCVVATSSLELGIDMGAVDLVIQVESPPSVAAGLQRVGRAGHQVGEVSRGVLFPKHRADLVHATVTTERMREGRIERIAVPQNPLDILAQQTVAHTALGPVDVDDWFEIVRRSAPFASLPRSAYEATLDLVSGLYPSDEFAELRPRIVWDRVSGTLTGRPGAQRLAVTSGGTIPDRGMFGVFLAGAERGGRVGELDEEMVYESRVGDVFALGATSWRIQDITHDRVVVTPAFGEPGRVPFWTGDAMGRSAELGAAIGAFLREAGQWTPEEAQARLASAGLDARAAQNLLAFLAEQRAATGQLPSDRTLVAERFRDELGDWRIVLHSPYGNRVHQPWALAITARIRERYGFDGGAMASDDGIVVRLPDTDADPPGADLFVFDPDELEHVITERVGDSALFASRFRECAARALLLPRRNPGRRSPLWQQRQRGAQLLEVARRYPSFPIVLETVREVLQDVYDVPALRGVAESIASRTIRLLEVETADASPFARSLLFGYVASFMYEGDAPLAERRAAALSLDTTMLAELLGRAELRELLDPDVIATTEAQLQRTHPERRLKGVEGAVDLLRLLGPMDTSALVERLDPTTIAGLDLDAALEGMRREQRVLRLQIAGAERWAVVEDAARLRDALGVPLPVGLPEAYLTPVPDAVGDLVSRYARTHGPFTPADAASTLGLGVAVVHDALRRLAGDRRVLEGEFRPGAAGTDWCDAEVLTRLRSRSLAALRKEVEPVEPEQLARFLPVWQHADRSLRGIDGVLQVVEQLAGAAVPASAWESLVLPARVRDYQPAMLDELTSTGEVLWSGDGTLPGADGWVRLHLAETAHLTIDAPTEAPDAAGQAVLDALGAGGGWFFRQLQQTLDVPDSELTATLWQLVWSGHVTNDTLGALRVRTGSSARRTRQPTRTRAYRGRMRPRGTTQSAAPEVGGRWTLTPSPDPDATVRRLANAEQLLERHGIVTRGAVQSEQVPGGFAAAYRVLTQLEEAGQTRRGYFVAGLGAAQFSTPATVDRLRAFGLDPDQAPPLAARTLAATDPANPFGAALPWPQRDEGHRPGRKAGALVTIVDGALTLFVERGGRTLLTFDDEPARLAAAAASLASVAPALGRIAVHRVDGQAVLGSALDPVLREAGFALTPKGLRLG